MNAANILKYFLKSEIIKISKKETIEIADRIVAAKINNQLVSNVLYKTNANYKGRKAKTKQLSSNEWLGKIEKKINRERAYKRSSIYRQKRSRLLAIDPTGILTKSGQLLGDPWQQMVVVGSFSTHAEHNEQLC